MTNKKFKRHAQFPEHKQSRAVDFEGIGNALMILARYGESLIAQIKFPEHI